MIIEISVAVIAFAFAVLAIVLILTLLKVQKSLDTLNQSLTTIKPLSEEVKSLVATTNEIAGNVLEKASTLDPIFNTLSQLGQYTENATRTFAEEKREYKEKKKSFNLEDWVEVAALGVGLWQKFRKKGRQ